MRDAIESASGDGKAVVARDDTGLTIDTAHWTLTSTSSAGQGRSKAPDSQRDIPAKADRPGQVPQRRRFIPLACGVAAAVLFLVMPRNADRPEPARLREPAPAVLPASGSSDTSVMAQELAESRGAVAALKAQLQAEAARNEQLLRQEQDKAAALAQEAATARQELVAAAAQHRQTLDGERAQRAALADQLAASQRELQTQTAQLRSANDDIEQLKQLATATSSQSLEQERQKVAALAQELSAAQREIAGQAAQLRKAGEEAGQLRQADAAKAAQALEQERQKAVALAQELSAAQREAAAQAAQLRKVGEDVGQLRQADAARVSQSQEQERQRAAAIAQASAARQALTTTLAQHRQALDEERGQRAALAAELATAQRELEVQRAQQQSARGESEKLKQASESMIAELRQALQQERDRVATAAEELASLRAAAAQPAVVSREAPKPPQANPVGAPPPQIVAEARNSPEAMRLIARASALLAQGDIGSARAVLERAADMGSARASFMLAETYDPRILSAWGTYGTRGEIARARELYARAQAGGIQEAKDRVDALPR